MVIDDDFKKSKENQIKSYFITSLIETANGNLYEFMKECSGKSTLLKTLVEACKQDAKTMKDNVDIKTDGDYESFDVNGYLNQQIADKDLDVDYDKVNSDEISNIVKDKVINTVKAEEERKKQDEQFASDVNDAKSVSESAFTFSEDREEFTLFKSMTMKNYKQAVSELKNGMVSESAYGVINEDNEIKINMDYILFDTLLEYTNLELLYTMKIKDFKHNDVRKMADNFAYKKID